MVIKLEILCQVAPSIFLGLHFRSLGSRSMLYGIIAGTAVTLFIMFNNELGFNFSDRPYGIHAGLIGFAVNVFILSLHHFLTFRPGQTQYR